LGLKNLKIQSKTKFKMEFLAHPAFLIGIGIMTIFIIIFIIIFIYMIIRNRRKTYTFGVIDEETQLLIQTLDTESEQNIIKERENELLNAKILLRSTTYEFEKAYFNIGRPHKQYFMVKKNKESYMMTILENKTRIVSTERSKKAFIEFVKNIEVKYFLKIKKHPNIYPISEVDFNLKLNEVVIFRKFCKKGSLRDFINKSSPLTNFSIKYHRGYKLQKNVITNFGKQILLGKNKK
jgi:hypothetical protein